MNCDHKTPEEYRVCNKCKTFSLIAHAAKRMLDARQKYMDQLMADPKMSDDAQYALQESVKRLEDEVRLATLSNLWD